MRIAFLGDIAFVGSFDIVNNPQASDGLRRMGDYLRKFDLVVANLESPFTINFDKGPAKSAYVGAHPENIKLLRVLNVDVCNLANNHIMDYGYEGRDTTIEVLENAGIKYFGNDDSTLLIEMDDCKLAFKGYCCYSTNPGKIRGGGCNKLKYSKLCSFLEGCLKKSTIPVVSVHAGIEHVHTPAIEHIEISRKLSEIAPYIYYGHHPHVLQGAERSGESVIAHSLGNFIFDETGNVPVSDDNRASAILEVTIEKNKITSYHLTPIYIGKGYIEVLTDQESPYENKKSEFDKALSDPDRYSKEREEKRNVWLKNRKKNRNLKWYLMRLTPRYVKLYLSNRYNYKQYLRYVKNSGEKNERSECKST